jgi:hypothetical protein
MKELSRRASLNAVSEAVGREAIQKSRTGLKSLMSKRTFAALGCVILLASCASRPSVSNYSEAEFRNITGVVTHLPVVTNLTVKPERVLGTYRGSGWRNKQTKSFEFDIITAKNRAVQNAIEKYGADVLLEPLFSIETVGAKITVTVSGYVANYTGGFRNATKEDAELLEMTGDKVIIANPKNHGKVEEQ